MLHLYHKMIRIYSVLGSAGVTLNASCSSALEITQLCNYGPFEEPEESRRG